jgi:hypothetical protein
VPGRRSAAPRDARLTDRVGWDERVARGGVRIVSARGALVRPDSRAPAERLATIARTRRGLRLVVVADNGGIFATVARAAGGAGVWVVDSRGKARVATA